MTKKGAVLSSSDPKIVTKIRSLNPNWYYTWGTTAILGLEDIPFTPMCWGANSVSKLTVPVPVLLGFNEPDGAAQSNLTPTQAVGMWPKLEAVSSRLGSPAIAGNASKTGSWLETFTNSNPKFDFVCVHWYAPPNSDSFLKQIDAIYTKYQKPIWITEFAVADWAGKYPGGYDVNLVSQFMKDACAGLEARDFVERYTWKTRTLSDANLGTSSLFNDDGSLTALGQIYSLL
ncbi:hypothetical protein AR679_gp241 [Yellowstone lake phycodnavirus 1]|uniref:hypothetical protein n=1 Tax=Yellowstone lake phycodnavirus 1 TaxID=1586713 RepID=UPI0006EB95B2|nr:hypothetical protein AR679_gp241 [Yellowstone lake phycodnavirus 1]BAT22267.1 hypothetical protein [Yellowstone lake phycodnavirus 1]